jgi:hypothetical protein
MRVCCWVWFEEVRNWLIVGYAERSAMGIYWVFEEPPHLEGKCSLEDRQEMIRRIRVFSFRRQANWFKAKTQNSLV